ncbi:hypothetical protein Ahy_A10g049864 [Arachis hypogaea]|uniref:Squalene cyclase N-terminal domain-containing protein n=1 Tax=Arachis hypogaea TaxID=3818 RepID=A0A445B813_ARAHY|nr:hypothetical protein Ahy_A10g049864 [Arachis hypogaea]
MEPNNTIESASNLTIHKKHVFTRTYDKKKKAATLTTNRKKEDEYHIWEFDPNLGKLAQIEAARICGNCFEHKHIANLFMRIQYQKLQEHLIRLVVPNKDGGWGFSIESLSTMFSSVLNYVVLRLHGEGPNHGGRNMEKAHNWI